MKLFAALVVIFAVTSSVTSDAANRGQYPFQAAIQDTSFGYPFHVCNGAIYDNEYIVTAAHCVSDIEGTKNYMQVLVGNYDNTVVDLAERQFTIDEVIIHEDYVEDTRANDIALLKLNDSIVFTQFVLPVNEVSQGDVLVGRCDITGWGITSADGITPNQLQTYELPILSDADCADTYGAKYNYTSMICAGSPNLRIDHCAGLGGAPLTCYDSRGFSYFAGLVTGSYSCVDPAVPNVYTDALYFKNWIRSHTFDPIF